MSQFEILKPVMQLARYAISLIRISGLRFKHTHLDDDKLSSAVHLTCLCLPNASCRCVHASSHTSNDSSYHHAGNGPTASLDDSPDSNDCRTKYNLPRSSKDISRPDCAHGANEAANVVDGGHHTLHVRRWVAEGVKEVLRDDDIAEDTLIVPVEAG